MIITAGLKVKIKQEDWYDVAEGVVAIPQTSNR